MRFYSLLSVVELPSVIEGSSSRVAVMCLARARRLTRRIKERGESERGGRGSPD